MGDIKFTIGNISKNQTFSSSNIKTDLDKNMFGNNKIQLSIFSKFDSKQTNNKIDSGLEQMLLFKKLTDAAAKDGDATNLSEDEALAFLAEQGIEDATAQDLFDFLNIAQGNKPKKEESVQQPPAQETKPQEPPVKQEQPQETKPQTQEPKVQEPPVQETPVKETAVPPEKQNEKPKKTGKPAHFTDIVSDNLNQNQENVFFHRAIKDRINMNMATGDNKIAWYSRTLTDENKGENYRLDDAQTLITPTGDKSFSVGVHTKISEGRTFSGTSAAGRIRTGNNSMFSGAVSYTAETGDNPSGFLNAKIAEQVAIPEAAGLTLSTAATLQNYNDPETKMTNAGLSVKAALPIPGKKDSGVLLGGSTFLIGDFSHSTSTATVEGITEQGQSNIAKGTLGVAYNFGFGKAVNNALNPTGDKSLNPKLTAIAQVSAFKMGETDNGTQIAGGAYSPFGKIADFGSIPGYGSWVLTGLGFSALPIVNTNKTAVTLNGSYSDNNIFGILKDVPAERSTSAGADVILKQSGLSFGAEYKSQITVNSTDRDIQAHTSYNFGLGKNSQIRLTAAGGYNTITGGYGQVGVSMNIIGNRHGKR